MADSFEVPAATGVVSLAPKSDIEVKRDAIRAVIREVSKQNRHERRLFERQTGVKIPGSALPHRNHEQAK